MAIARPMVPGDYPVVAQISNDAASRALVGMPTWETSAEVAASVASLRQAEFIVAEDDNGRVVGFAGYAMTSEGAAALYGPLVTAAGHGFGAYLSSRIESLARQRGASQYTMLIGLNNRQGSAWAEWRGYQLDTESPETLLCWVYPGELRAEPVQPGSVVRKAQPGDLERVDALYQSCYQPETATTDQWTTWLPSTWVLEEKGELKALLHLHRGTTMIRHLCIAPAAHGVDVAGQLLSEAVQACWTERPAKVGIALPLDNQSFVSLVRRLGFRREIAVARWMKRDG